MKTDLPFAPKKEIVILTPGDLQKFTGSFNLQSGVHTVITLEGASLFIEAVGLGKFELLPQSNASFTIKGVPASLEFQIDNNDTVKGFVLLQSGGKMEAKRVD